jgi:hypothetical protein
MKPLTRHCLSTLLILAVCGGAVAPAMADGVRSTAQTSVTSTYNPNYNPNVNANYNPNVNPNYNPNVLVNRNAPASAGPSVPTRRVVNAEVEGGSQDGCCYQEERAAPTGAAMTIPAPATEAILASNPSDCATVVTNDFIFRRCGTVWYQAQMTDTTTTWVVVDNPE